MSIADEKLLTLAQAFDDLRGLDSALIQELDLSADDIISLCHTAAFVLAAHTKAPAWIKSANLVAGALAVDGDELGLATNVYYQAQMRDVARRLKT